MGCETRNSFSLSLGWNHYSCKTPLGRRYHLTGPNAGIGIGIGAIIDMSLAERTSFSLLLDSKTFRTNSDDAKAWAALIGKGETYNNLEEKSSDVTLGLGFHSMQRGHLLVKIKKQPKFKRSGLYDFVDIPKEALF